MTTHVPNGRVMASVWLCAIVIAVGGMVGLLQITLNSDSAISRDAKWLQPPPFGVFIGTSLVRHAFPSQHPANDIFHTAETNDRIVRVDGQSEIEIIERVRRAANAGAKKIFVEINPLLLTYQGHQISADFAVRDFSNRLRAAALQWLAFWPAVDYPGNIIYDGNIRAFALNYPVYAHAPRDPAAITEALAVARRQGLDIVWVAMPRSQTAAAYLGPAFEIAFSGQLQAFAAAFNATVWRPAIFWPNEFFIDQAHMNIAGRARFMSELRRYGATAR